MTSEPGQYRILLVEDDAELASMVKDFLLPHGFDVQIESRGDTAVDRITGDNPDVVVLDINLPGLDGLSVCQAVRANYDGAIIMLTARGEEVDEVLGLEAGADDYMAKPVRPRALFGTAARPICVGLLRQNNRASPSSWALCWWTHRGGALKLLGVRWS